MKKIFMGSLALAILHSILFFGQKWGISILLYMIPLIFFVIDILAEKGKIKNTKPLILAIPILCISATYLIFNNAFFQICNMIAIIVLFLIMIILSVLEEKKILDIVSQVVLLIAKPFAKIEEVVQMIVNQVFARKDNSEKDTRKHEIIKKVGLGVIILVPILLIVLALLTSADSIFAQELGGITKWIQSIFKGMNIREIVGRIALIILFTIYGASFIYNILVDAEEAERQIPEQPNKLYFDHIVVNTILTGLNIIYLVFCYIQIVNLFMGYTNLSQTEYAEYARSGFFQLMAVSFINLVIILTTTHNSKEGSKGQISYTKGMNLLLAIATFIILISSFMRMYLYEQAFGYTFLRLMVYMILITEAILMVPTIIHIFNKKINLIKPYFAIILVMYLVVNYMNVDAMIAKKNIDRYFEQIDKSEQTTQIEQTHHIIQKNNVEQIEQPTIDFSYLKTTGIDGIFQVQRLLNVKDENLKKQVNNYIYQQKAKYKNDTWQSFNINRYRLQKEFGNIDFQY